MCGIAGFLNYSNSFFLTKEALAKLKSRGKDAVGISNLKEIIIKKRLSDITLKETQVCIGHLLHAIVSEVPQPLKEKGLLVSNCEIYNWETLAQKYSLNAKNDSSLLLLLIEKIGLKKALKELDGPYAFAYLRKDKLIVARDILGVKPLWYRFEGSFAFASEKKVSESLKELNPRKIITYSLKEKKIIEKRRQFFNLPKETDEKKEEIVNKLSEMIILAVSKRIPKTRFGVLFSGGIDSTLIAFILKKLGQKPILYTAALKEDGLKEAEDLTAARKASKMLNLPLKESLISLEETKKAIPYISRIIESRNIVKIGVALPFHFSCISAKKDNCKVLFSGLGSEEIFAGYQRHREVEESKINKECRKGLLMMHKRDNYRDDVLTMHHNLELRHPFLDKELIKYSLSIPGRLKISNNQEKYILREAAKYLGLREEFADRKKRAAQYGSNFDKALSKLAKKEKMQKQEYLNSIIR